MRKIAALALAAQLIFVPAAGFAQAAGVENVQPKKSMNAKMSLDKKPKLYAAKDYSNPSEYPLVNNGGFAGGLSDSYNNSQYIYFEDITTSTENSNDMNIKLLYGSDDANNKDGALSVEFFQEESGYLNFAGGLSFDTAGVDAVYLNSLVPKADFADQPFIYMRVGVSEYSDDPYYSDVISFKAANPFYTGGHIATDDRYAVISNESPNGSATQTTGSFDVKNKTISMDKKLPKGAYKMDVNKPFDHALYKGKLVRKNARSILPTYNVGDSKYFWVSDWTTNTDSQINARLAYSGAKANVWVYNNQITDSNAVMLGKEFDSRIYPSVTSNFGLESDVNHDGKVNILCYDIQDGYADNGGYVAGYFYSGDLYNVEHSNQSEIFYVDTYPTMGSGSTKDVSGAYETLAHEFQHMVNFNQNALIEGNSDGMDTWLDEALAMAAEQIYTGHGLSDRVDYYNVSSSIKNGHSLLYWDDYGDTLANYSLSYLFGQYLKIQTGQGNGIFKEILADPNNNYKAVENIAKKYISPDMTFGKLMTNFRIALLLKEGTGPYGFKGDPFFDALQERIYSGSPMNLRGGGAVVTTFNSKDGFAVPASKGANVTYTILNKDGVQKSGWVSENGQWYYYDVNTGAMKTGWLKDGTKWYYLDGNGVMKTGWLKDGTKWYYLDGSGAMRTGWLKDGTKWYYLDASGAMKTGWLKDGAKWYYLDASGAMKTGWLKIGTAWYYLEGSGAMKTGWMLLGGKWYYFNTSGVWVK